MECPLGCFDDQRCRSIVPSNGFAVYLDVVAAVSDLDLENVTINTQSGVITNNLTNQPIPVMSFFDTQPTFATRVIVANRVRLKDVQVLSGTDPLGAAGPALAIVARGPIVVEGTLHIAGSAGGVGNDPLCRGGRGSFNSASTALYARGSGGGGHATPGANGGSVSGGVSAGGQASGNESLEPLRGGCPSGGSRDEYFGDVFDSAYPGGGAVQLTSEVSVEIAGKIDVRGMHGDYEAGPMFTAVYGSGAGGGVLLEAPRVSLGPAAKIIAKGGGGGAYGGSFPADDDTSMPSPGATCTGGTCGNGGDGATSLGAATAGASVANGASGGGGGGLGRLRVNTRDGTYAKTSSAIEVAATTTGVVKTR